MARDLNPKCKQCRRLGTKLFLKGERCFAVKCALTKRNYPPGAHGQKGQSRLTDYGLHLREKQKLKKMYGIFEKQLRKYFAEAVKGKANTGFKLIELLERRFDNVVYKLGLADSRQQARQFIGHNLFFVNNKKVNIPSFVVKSGDVISIKKTVLNEKSLLAENLKKAAKKEVANWLVWSDQEKQGRVVSLPTGEELNVGVDPRLIVEFYSK